MPHSAAVLCHDKRSLQTLETTLAELGIELMNCRSQQDALELVMTGRCSTLIVDFDLSGAQEAIRTAALLPPPQRPALLAIASRAWPGTGQAFQSGASRILYKPVEAELVREALKADRKNNQDLNSKDRRKTPRYPVKTLVYLELETGTISGISIDISEHGLALQATEPVPMASNLAFRCALPGTEITLHGHADVIWTSDQGRAGLFFSKLAPAARKHLQHWLSQNCHQNRNKNSVRDLLPPADAHVSFAAKD